MTEKRTSKDRLSQLLLRYVRQAAYKNWQEEGDIGFEFHGMFIRTPFYDETGRFEIATLEEACEHYGQDNVYGFVKQVFQSVFQDNEKL